MSIFGRGMQQLRIYLLLQGHPHHESGRLGRHFDFAGRPRQTMVLEWFGMDRLMPEKPMRKNIAGQKRRSSQAGISLIEVLMASVILVIGSLGMILLIV